MRPASEANQPQEKENPGSYCRSTYVTKLPREVVQSRSLSCVEECLRAARKRRSCAPSSSLVLLFFLAAREEVSLGLGYVARWVGGEIACG
jgi:hypothetical protein